MSPSFIWVGYATVKDINKPQPKNKEDKSWDKAYMPIIFGCEHYEVNYTVQFDYVRGAQSYKTTNREYVRKVVNTTHFRKDIKKAVDPRK
ncbi:hypothetical protein H9Q69_007920 [Fusarium xylarioides]|uniref:Uncharacterized protein n=1 Tax=Fusarium xylarioides TaxID=221167 RepID=A0A9P7I3K1_9HYPO|nr:hypothetical protein H9Q70_006221 [Fusarium xylarioides]KAG5768804.1 hypothetical protein H9Q72_003789 [Fusarium xylarioides]KAG5793046.1 hypothetical protein H9Q69_007920 [Fusarium xylarioides]KAG5813855.1 hypothetical protein H9Q71_003508 [Fusarium xylarioides]KAG5826389.1 hypothetical protein H9Q74_003529 [Fusarium xylarioides]